MLRDRLIRALEVYEAGAAPKLLMSGDHGREDYDEVGAMKNYAKGIYIGFSFILCSAENFHS